ncbi:TPA: hypothetical protein N0F65_005534 [Lagenidium giganteum]|uniref:Glycoside hydrolase family 5 domain-containing protein n=1 Tax=Lagenidium giganteum TaxID=4803 RepID=A0AAV2YSA1_9STRA|nr:TPA: hypothetical protein N0F65_005534 [Lagenidium giganteum]
MSTSEKDSAHLLGSGSQSPPAGDGSQSARPSASFEYSYRMSQMDSEIGSTAFGRPSTAPLTRQSSSSANGVNDVFVRGSLLDRDIEVQAPMSEMKPERKRDYKGRIRTWPGLMLLIVILGGAAFAVAYFAVDSRSSAKTRGQAFAQKKFNATKIKGGNSSSNGKDIISDDGIVGNPKSYPASQCELPNYLSKKGGIYAVSSNGTEVRIQIKGINWFGMETGQAMPFGLWDNSDNGTTVYQIASFLADNKFNAVRLPLMVTWILKNHKPNEWIINKQENRAICIDNYMCLLKSILKVLAYRQVGVLLSMHTLTFTDNGKLWYNDDVSEDDFLKSIDILTKNLCTQEYWNIMGIDLKNEPYRGTWGDGGKTDFHAASIRIADRMLKGCSKWMGFVEGVNDQRSVTIDGKKYNYYDWYGGGLQGAKTVGLEFGTKDKLVWAPHYYTPAVFPQYYLFGGGTVGTGNAIDGYVELDDDALRGRIKATIDDMFGFLYSESGPAILLGEFGGLYAKDAHPKKTTKRCTDFTIEIIKKWAGGFVWSLNPESAYQYNPADTPGNFVEGLLEADWMSANPDYMKGMAAMDDMPDLKMFPCFPTKALPSASGSGSSAGSSG